VQYSLHGTQAAGKITVAKTAEQKLAEVRELLFGAGQALYTIAAVLRDREMVHTATSVESLAEMLSESSVTFETEAA
jgi:malic enzyme